MQKTHSGAEGDLNEKWWDVQEFGGQSEQSRGPSNLTELAWSVPEVSPIWWRSRDRVGRSAVQGLSDAAEGRSSGGRGVPSTALGGTAIASNEEDASKAH